MPEEKTCSKCGVIKSICEFRLSGNKKKDGTRHFESWCKSCKSIANMEWEKRNRKKRNAICKKWYGMHRIKRAEYADRYRDDLQKRCKQALSTSRSKAKRDSFIPCSATVGELIAAFTGACHICGIKESECRKRLSMDHDWATGKFRGWLCCNCNHMLGQSKDSAAVLLEAVHYLKQGS